MKHFGSSGIRMIWSEELCRVAWKVGCALGSIYEEILVGYDARTTSHAIFSKIVAGICAAGGNAYAVGLAPTPAISFATRNYDCGVVVTASHNPPEYNGIKIWKPDGSPLSESECEELENLIERVKISDWKQSGKVLFEDISLEYIEDILKRVGETEIDVVVDTGNGAASNFSPLVLSKMGCRVYSINSNPNGKFPGRDPEPSEASLHSLRRLVVRSGSKLGIANDGDGDRFIAVTRRGKVLCGDEILSVIVNYFGIKEVVVPVDSSMLIENFARVHRCKVGDFYVSNTMKNLGVKFGGENSGTQIFGDRMYSPDGIFSAALFAKIASEIDIDGELESYPRYFTIRKSFGFRDKEKFVKMVEEAFDEQNITRIDGWKIEKECGWILIRFSGTEPKVRITVEACTEDDAKRLFQEVVERLRGELI